MQPAIKWSGSKRSQAGDIVLKIREIRREKGIDQFRSYHEPFCGGASVLFYILENCPDLFNRYIISDINKDLTDLLTEISVDPFPLFMHYLDLWRQLNQNSDLDKKKDFFNSVRKRFNKEHNPADFLFLMRTTTNGNPRYNKKGQFNNSFHVTRNGILPSTLRKILDRCHYLLREYRVQILNCDYKLTMPYGKNSFAYFDPPYFHTKGMYYGKIDYDEFWNYLKKVPCSYCLSFDGTAGAENNIVNVPEDLYDEHVLLDSGNSSFRRVIGKNNSVHVKESLYTKIVKETA